MASLVFAALLASANGKTVKSPTPPMGWNSYNHYNCRPSEDIIKINAKGLVDLGFKDLGYSIVTVDCGWPSRDRDSKGRLQWNETLFPSGPKALGEYIHDLGLEFGLYSGAGYLQCGSTDIPASLDYEEIDAKSFAEWGGDTLKYDNCYATSKTNMVDADSAEAKSPNRFIKMAAAINETDRDIKYFLCQWGIGEDVPQWAAPLGNSWRMSNDIFNAWRAIWRITNQVVAHAKYNGPGAFADMDMLIIGLGALSHDEERFHFGFWSMMKSPLIIGGVMDAKQIPAESLEIMSNKEVIAINQDPLAEAAKLVIRYTEEEWDIWAGNLSSNRKVLGVLNWKNETQTVKVDLSLIGVDKAAARDVWAHEDLSISGIQEFKLAPHELRQLILSDISPASPPKAAGYYSAQDATLSGSASLVNCKDTECLPTHKKVGSIGKDAKVTFKSVSAPKDGSVYLGIDYINHEYHHTIGDWETNSRNMSISVNGEDAKRWAFPNAGGDWFESDRLTILVDGFKKGDSNHGKLRKGSSYSTSGAAARARPGNHLQTHIYTCVSCGLGYVEQHAAAPMTTRSAQLDAMTTRRTLPPELLYHVMESVLPPNPHALLPPSHASTKTLLALTRVCRDTYRLATRLLRQRCVYINTSRRLADYLVCIQRFVPTMPAPLCLRTITSLYLEPFGGLLNDLLAAMWMRELLCEVSETLRRLVVLIPFQNVQPLHNWQEMRRTLREGFERLHKLEEFVAIGDYPVLSVPDAPTDVWRLWPELKRLTLFNAPADNHWLWWDIATLPKLQHVILARSLNVERTNIKDEYFHKLPRHDARLDRDLRIVLMDAASAKREIQTARWKEIDPNGRMTVELLEVAADEGSEEDPRKLVADYVKEQALNGCLWDGKTKILEESESE